MIAEKQNGPLRVLALLAQKGGAGKTRLALHLAVVAQQAGLRTVLVDLDPQRSAAGWWRARAAQAPELIETDADRLTDVIEAAAADGVALLVVDTRPSVERDAAEVARHADLALIPTRPAILDLRAIGATTEVEGGPTLGGHRPEQLPADAWHGGGISYSRGSSRAPCLRVADLTHGDHAAGCPRPRVD